VLDAAGAGVDHAVRAGVGDVASNGAADQGGDDQEVDLLRQYDVLQRLANRWCGDDGYVEHQKNHDGTEKHDDAVQGHAGFLGQEDQDGDHGRNRTADFGIHTEHGIDAESGAGDIADVKDHASDEYEDRQEPAHSRQHPVAKLLSAHPGDTDDAPDVQLYRDVDEDRDDDGECEGSADLYREFGGLGNEARADGAGGHEEHCPK